MRLLNFLFGRTPATPEVDPIDTAVQCAAARTVRAASELQATISETLDKNDQLRERARQRHVEVPKHE